MKKQLLLLLFSVLAVLGYARTVTGVVKQASDGEPIIGATVQVHGTTRGTATDLDEVKGIMTAIWQKRLSGQARK